MAVRPLRALAQHYVEGELDYAGYRAQRGELLDALAEESRLDDDTPRWSSWSNPTNPSVTAISSAPIINNFVVPSVELCEEQASPKRSWYQSWTISAVMLALLGTIMFYLFPSEKSEQSEKSEKKNIPINPSLPSPVITSPAVTTTEIINSSPIIITQQVINPVIPPEEIAPPLPTSPATTNTAIGNPSKIAIPPIARLARTAIRHSSLSFSKRQVKNKK